jgi:hypothetical protein
MFETTNQIKYFCAINWNSDVTASESQYTQHCKKPQETLAAKLNSREIVSQQL